MFINIFRWLLVIFYKMAEFPAIIIVYMGKVSLLSVKY